MYIFCMYYKIVLKWVDKETKTNSIISSSISSISFKCKKWKFIFAYYIYRNILIGNIKFKNYLKLKSPFDGDTFYDNKQSSLYFNDSIAHIPVQIIFEYDNDNDNNHNIDGVMYYIEKIDDIKSSIESFKSKWLNDTHIIVLK